MTIQEKYNNLPASQIADEVNRQLKDNPCLVITAPPGAGKSTLLPLTIAERLSPDTGKEGSITADCANTKNAVPRNSNKIIVLEPRRLAARQIAGRMADMIGEDVGDTVGYRIRFENKVSSSTRIEVVTEGILTRMLIDDSTLEGVSVIIFDEFHERNIHSDVALALAREAQQILRPDLRIVIMSATIDATSICKALQAPLIQSQGRMYPVEIINTKEEADLRANNSSSTYKTDITDQVTRAIIEAHRSYDGDILVFLPGQAEILRCKERLAGALGNTHIYPLYGQLTSIEQQLAIVPSRQGERKVVLATNIAETSLTIEGVRIVIDSGLCRTLTYDQRSGLSHLETVRISMDMANQRSGRAGRLSSGVCYRLWTLATEHRMPESRTPEIETADLTSMVLDIAAWQGSATTDSIQQMQWMTTPPAANVRQAMQLLTTLGALDNDGRLTTHGRRLAALPCHPRIAQMLITAINDEERSLAADIAAILEESDPLSKHSASQNIDSASSSDSDINTRIIALRQARANAKLRQWERIERISAQYRRLVRVSTDNTVPDRYTTGKLIASAWQERIAHAQANGTYTLSNGNTAKLDASDDLSAHDWIAIASLNAQPGGRIYLASPLNVNDIQKLAIQNTNVQWDSRQGCILAQNEQRIGRHILASTPIQNIPQDEITRIICEAAPKEGLTMFDFNDAVHNLQQRIATVAEWHPELDLPDTSTTAVLQAAGEWLPMFIGKSTSVSELRKIDMTQAIWSLLSYEQQQQVEALAPTHIQVPTGSRIRVEYRNGAEHPILRVRLQECFGLTDTPRVDNGTRPVLMELLSPGFKPVQLTQDLNSFWQGTYFEVRKELKRRYPKHYWPDNPLEAEPTRTTKRK